MMNPRNWGFLMIFMPYWGTMSGISWGLWGMKRLSFNVIFQYLIGGQSVVKRSIKSYIKIIPGSPHKSQHSCIASPKYPASLPQTPSCLFLASLKPSHWAPSSSPPPATAAKNSTPSGAAEATQPFPHHQAAQ